MKIGVPKEIKVHEYRVGLTPDAVGELTARGFHRAWRVARTLADLEEAAEVGDQHVLEALGYRLVEVAA